MTRIRNNQHALVINIKHTPSNVNKNVSFGPNHHFNKYQSLVFLATSKR